MIIFLMTGRSASLLLRVVSKCIDFILVLVAVETLPKAGWLVGFGYILISDGLFEGRSIGKRLTGLRVLGDSGAPCSIKESILRNSTFAVGMVLWKIPFLGWPLLLSVMALEFIILLGSREGRRLGDEIAKTSVLEITEAKEEN